MGFVGTLALVDDLLAPRDTINVSFNGKNPFAAAAVAPRFIRYIMKVPGKDVLETDVRWDLSGKTPEFYGMWMGKRTMDRWSTIRIRFVIQGSQDEEKNGWVSVDIKGTLLTKYDYTNFIQRSFWWFYNHFFYNRQRRMYIEEGKDMMYEMREQFQRLLGISQEAV